MKELSDNECVLLARHGNGPALAELIHRYTAGVFHLFVRLLGDRDLATDCTQEVFLRAHRGIDRFDAARSFRAWLYAIAWNHGRDQLRSRKRRGVTRRLSSEARDDSEGGPALDPVDPSAATPFEVLETKERKVTLKAALDELKPRERALLVLREMEGLSYDELAELVGCRVGTIKSSLNRARLRLKDALLRLDPGLAAN